MISNYHTCQGRALLDWKWLDKFGMPRKLILKKLERLGFHEISVDIEKTARSMVGTGEFDRRSVPSQAPEILNCSRFIEYLANCLGASVPCPALELRRFGDEVDAPEAGDLIFASGIERNMDYYDHDREDSVGHVGLWTSRGTVIHAYPPDPENEIYSPAIHEESKIQFLKGRGFRGYRRIFPVRDERLTLRLPFGAEVCWAQEIVCRVSTILWSSEPSEKESTSVAAQSH